MAQHGALDQRWTFFAVVHDPRRQHPTTLPPLETIRSLTLLATLGGAPHGGEIAPWGPAQAEGRAEWLALPQGMPSHDPCGRVLAGRAPASLQPAFGRGMTARAARSPDFVALAGNTLRRALARAEGPGPMPVVPAWASAHARGLAPGNGAATTHESTARPAWLRRLHGAGAVVTLEARGGQAESARQLQAPGADAGRSCKEKQPGVYRDGAPRCPGLRGAHPLAQPVAGGRAAQGDGGHGRLETRRRWSIEAREGVGSSARWAGLPRLVMGEALRRLGASERVARRDDRSSLPGACDEEAQRLTRGMRPPWESEHRVHGVVDGARGEDGHRTRQGERAQKLA